MTVLQKFGLMALALGLFVVVIAILLFVGGRFTGRSQDRSVALIFLAPVVIGLGFAVVYPAIRTVYESLRDSDGQHFVGFGNFSTIFTSADQLVVLRNTALWVILSPVVATGIGLLYAVLVDRSRFESVAKALIFLPMAISFVGASIIWKFVYEYRPDQPGVRQIGILNQVVVWLGGSPQEWLITSPWNSLFLVVVMIWTQAGFAMTVLSAAIKGIPQDIVEAARMDGISGPKLFRYITVPIIRSSVLVVLTTIAIWTLKVFDIVRTMTGGQFDTSVIANEFYTQSFRSDNQGVGSALAVLLFVLVIPVVVYNVRQTRKERVR